MWFEETTLMEPYTEWPWSWNYYASHDRGFRHQLIHVNLIGGG
jgi:hypothetical protein